MMPTQLVAWTLALAAMGACGSDQGQWKDVGESFIGKTECTDDASFDCACVQMNSPEDQQRTGRTILKCPFQPNFEQARAHPYCLNRDPDTGKFRTFLDIKGCPWSETPKETVRLLSSE
jgi:hypothetical protein